MKHPVAHVRKLIISAKHKKQTLKRKKDPCDIEAVNRYFRNQESPHLPSYFYDSPFIKLNGEHFYIGPQQITKMV